MGNFLNPSVNWRNIDAFPQSKYIKKVVLVGQSNTATAGIHENIQNLSVEQVNSKFGAGSHLAAMLREVVRDMSSSTIKPIMTAISYEDKSDGVKRVVTATFSGTATEDRTLNLKLNSLNPDVLAAKYVTALALRNTKGAVCGENTQNGIEFGSPKNVSMPINPKFRNIFDNDCVVEVNITSGMTAAQVATAVSTAVNAKAEAIYTATTSTADLILTADHKGTLGKYFAIEFVPGTLASGVSVSLANTTAESGVVDATGILALTNSENIPLSDIDFDFIVLPYGYSVAALTTDANAKFNDVFQYNNRCLDYFIFRNAPLDLSNATEINSLASAEPVEAKGVVKQILISKIDGFKIVGINDKTTRDLVTSKQFTPVQREQDGSITIGTSLTLSNSEGFKRLSRVLPIMFIRQMHVEEFFSSAFVEKSYKEGTALGVGGNGFTLSKDEIISEFKYWRDLFDGTIVNDAIYGSDLAEIVDNSSTAKRRFDEIVELSFSFDKTLYQMRLDILNTLTNPIESIYIRAFNA